LLEFPKAFKYSNFQRLLEQHFYTPDSVTPSDSGGVSDGDDNGVGGNGGEEMVF